MWYIWFLILVTPLATLLYKLHLPKTIWLILILLFVIVATFWGGPLNGSFLPLGIQHLTSLPIYYGIGIYFARKDLYKKMIRKTSYLCLASLFAILYIIYLQTYNTYPNQYLPVHTLFRYVNGVAMAYLMMSFLILLSKKLPTILAWFGKHSLYFYLIHTYILTILTLFIKKYFLNLPILLLVLTTFLALLFVNTMTILIVKKIPILEKLFQGKLLPFPTNNRKNYTK